MRALIVKSRRSAKITIYITIVYNFFHLAVPIYICIQLLSNSIKSIECYYIDLENNE